MTTEEALDYCFNEAIDFSQVQDADPAENAQNQVVVGVGIELLSYTDEWMPMLYEDGKLILTGYESTRGNLYQRGAYNGTEHYSANNLYGETGWVTQQTICSEIAEKIWKGELEYGHSDDELTKSEQERQGQPADAASKLEPNDSD